MKGKQLRFDPNLETLFPKRVRDNCLLWQCVAEMVGTFFIVVFGVGSVNTAVLSQQLVGLWQVAVIWGFGIMLAIYATASISGAHLNPAVSLTLAILRPSAFSWSHVLPYMASQLLGAILGGFVNLLAWYDFINKYEEQNAIQRGEKGSIFTAMLFGQYFPNPAMDAFRTEDTADLEFDKTIIAPWYAMLIEAWGTAILLFMIFMATDKRQKAVPKGSAPFLIGFTVAVLIGVYAPITQAGWNPARDFGPRLVAVMCGWGWYAIPGPRGGFWVYIIGPLIGGPIGGAMYDLLLGNGMNIACAKDGEFELLFAHHMPECAESLEMVVQGETYVFGGKQGGQIVYKKRGMDVYVQQ